MRKMVVVAGIFGVTVLAAAGVQAQLLNFSGSSGVLISGFYVWPAYSGGTTLFSLNQSGSIGQISQVNDSASTPNTVPQGTVGAQAQAFFSGGTLRAMASTSATSANPSLYTEADATANASFNDQFMLESATLPAGTDVTIGESIALNESITSVSNTGGACVSASAVGSVTLTGFGLSLADSGCGITGTSSTIAVVPIGSVQEIVGALSASSTAFAESGQGFGTSSSNTADAYDTGSFFITLPQGVTLVSGSGANYSVSEVPLPASILLFGSGLFALLGVQIARRRTRA